MRSEEQQTKHKNSASDTNYLTQIRIPFSFAVQTMMSLISICWKKSFTLPAIHRMSFSPIWYQDNKLWQGPFNCFTSEAHISLKSQLPQKTPPQPFRLLDYFLIWKTLYAMSGNQFDQQRKKINIKLIAPF